MARRCARGPTGKRGFGCDDMDGEVVLRTEPVIPTLAQRPEDTEQWGLMEPLRRVHPGAVWERVRSEYESYKVLGSGDR